MKNKVRLIAILTITMMFATATVMAQKAGGPWEIPAKYKTMKSTVKAGDASINTTGKELFNKHCKSCHGTKGLGDGPKSAMMKTKMPSFADPKFKAETDGEIYYQSIVGRDEMPNFEKKIVDEADRWALVGYVRSLK
ncbi:MAG TPA: cytochrome c [Lentimicrobium sp.]|jgi:mono/diheme cytochrome c family protein|nr:cytochrome c [Lentimicrobium sp.]